MVDYGAYPGTEEYETWRVYEKDGKFWKWNYHGGHVTTKWGGNGYLKDVYEPIPCVKETHMVEMVEWIEHKSLTDN